VLIPQLVVWPVLTLVFGLLGAAAFVLATRRLQSRATSPAKAGR
jgi:ABC-type transporter Mla subunit MlaD